MLRARVFLEREVNKAATELIITHRKIEDSGLFN